MGFRRSGFRPTPLLYNVLRLRQSYCILFIEQDVKREALDMAWRKLADIHELENKKIIKIEFNDGRKVLVVKQEEDYFCFGHLCPHMRLPLQGGEVEDGAVVCPWHHSAFDLETGDVKDWSPWPPVVGRVLGAVRREKALPVFPTKIENNFLFADIPDA